MTVTVDEPIAEVEQPRPPGPVADLLLRIAGVVISLLATVVTAAGELFLTPLRVAGVLTGVSIPLALVANVAIAWFAVRTTGRRWAVGPPWALWTVLMFVAAGVRTTEGDYLLGGNDWIALVMILVGSLAFAVYAYRTILNRGASVTKL